jgi:tetratricopeptide (TPR) repeat protein
VTVPGVKRLFFIVLLSSLAATGWGNAIEHINRGFHEARQGSLAQALESYTRAIESGELLGASLAYVYRIRGDLFYRAGSYDNAIKDFDNALNISPNDEVALNNRGSTWFAKREYDRAIEDYSDSLKINPDNGQIYHNRSLILLEQGKYALSIKDSSEAIRINPKNYYAYINRGSAHFGLGEIDNALADYTEAISINPASSDAYYNRSIVWVEKKELPHALHDIREAIRLDPEDPGHYLHRSQLYMAIGDETRAGQDHRKAEKLAGKVIPGPEKQEQNQELSTTSNKPETTDQSAQETVDGFTPPDTDPRIELLEKNGWTHFFNASYDAALSDFRAIAEISPDNMYSQLWLFITSGHGGTNPFDAISHDINPELLNQWPGVLLQFFLGKKSEVQVLEYFANDPIQSRLEKSCEASYYIGEYYLINGQVDRALGYFKKAIATGLSDFLAFRNSKSHIKILGKAD